MSAHQLYRMMGRFYDKKGSFKTAWFMFHRLRFAMERVTLENLRPLTTERGEAGTTIPTDESIVYHFMRNDYPKHDVVTDKKKEYSRREDGRLIRTNTVGGHLAS